MGNATQGGLSALNAEVTRQASIIAYADDFKLMLAVTITASLGLFLIRRVEATGRPAPAHLD